MELKMLAMEVIQVLNILNLADSASRELKIFFESGIKTTAKL